MRHHITRIVIIGIFVLCGLLTGTAPDAAAQQPTPIPTPKPQPKEWQVNGVLAALNDELPGVQYLAVKKAVELGIAEQIPDEEIPKIIRLLKYDDNNVNYDDDYYDDYDLNFRLSSNFFVAKLLGCLGDRVTPYLSELISLAADQDSPVQIQAIRALGELGSLAKETVPKFIRLLSDKNKNTRLVTTNALGNLGKAAKEAVPILVKLLSDTNENDSVRLAAAKALRSLGETAKEAVPILVKLLSDTNENDSVRLTAAKALGNLGETTKEVVPILVELLFNKNENIRKSAVIALGNIGKPAQVSISELVRLLSENDPSIRVIAAQALVNIEENKREAAMELISLLSESRYDVSQTAKSTLRQMGDSAKIVLPELIQTLSDKNWEAQEAAALTLGSIGEAAKVGTPDLIRLLRGDNPNARQAAAWALGKMGETAQTVMPELIKLLSSDDMGIQAAAAMALGNIGEPTQTAIPELVRMLRDDENGYLQQTAVRTLAQIWSADWSVFSLLPFILDRIYANREVREERRFLAHFLGAGEPDVERLLLWLGKPASYPVILTYDDARETLRVFKESWQYMQKLPDMQADLEEKIMIVATLRKIFWTQADWPLLKSLLADLESVNSIHADALRREIVRIEGRKWGILVLQILGVHVCFWLILLLLYPFSSHIQALVWQPLFRHLFGLYLPLLLTAVPFLKRWLLRPFRQVLLADAKLEQFDAARYFPEMEVAFPGQNATQPLFSAVPRLRGQVVIEGDSGLGKTMFARALLRRSRRAAVFLPAEKCVAGIVEAIHAKLPEIVADRRFLRKLVCGGSLDLYVDGLNEVSADTRAAITQFVERSFKGNALLTTQPLEWQPPATARVFVLQPLRRDRIEAYLLSRYDLFAETPDAIGQTGYESACRAYLAEAFDSRQPPELLASNQRILSNPMDAVIVAQMLAHGETPSLFRLEEQQYTLMAADFARRHIGQAFPLAEFAERVYQMRLNDRAALPFEEFPDEIACMERHKMAVRRLATERTRPNSVAPIAIETRRLPFELRRQIIAFLTALPNMQHQAAQQAFVNSLALDAPLKQGD